MFTENRPLAAIRMSWAGEQQRQGLEPFPCKGRGGAVHSPARPRVVTEGQVPVRIVLFLISPPSSSISGRSSEALSDLVFSLMAQERKVHELIILKLFPYQNQPRPACLFPALSSLLPSALGGNSLHFALTPLLGAFPCSRELSCDSDCS